MKKLRLPLLLLLGLVLGLVLCGCSSDMTLSRDPDNPYMPNSQGASGVKNSPYEISYTSNGDGTCYVDGVSLKEGKSPASVLEIPARSPAGDTVTAIRCEPFGDGFKTVITEIKLPDSVAEISEGFYTACPSLTQIDLPDSLREISPNMFYGLKYLKSVSIPSSVTVIGKNAFTECDALRSLTIPDGVREIGVHAFTKCDSLKQIVLAKSVREIGTDAFLDLNFCSVYYEGTRTEWYSVRPNTTSVDYVTYYYSETQPSSSGSGKYWRYVDGDPVLW